MPRTESKGTATISDSLAVQVSNDLTVQVLPHIEHEFLMPTADVAAGYGVSPDTVRSQKFYHQNEFIEGTHFIASVGISNAGLQRNSTLWTKAGVIRLGFFIKSERAKLFRDWAEHLILSVTAPKLMLPATTEKRRHNRLTPARIIDILTDVARIEDKELRLRITSKLTGGSHD